MRQIVLWAALAVIALLLCLSIIGAFLGDERATAMFNSLPLAVFWVLLVGLFIGGLLLFKRLIRSPGLLAVHLGSLLILAGAMYGSDKGHELTSRLFGSKKIPHGYMRIYERQASNSILDDSGKMEIGKLPFSVGLRDFRIEFYHPWPLIVEFPQLDQKTGKTKWIQESIEWRKGQDVAIPGTEAFLQVLEYIESARPAYASDTKPTLEITPAGGKTTTVPAELGRDVVLEEPHVHLRIVQVFSNLRVQGSGPDRQVIDMPGQPENPALKIELTQADGKKTYRYVYGLGQFHTQQNDGLELRYIFAEPTGAQADPSTHLPAMEVFLKYKGKQQRHWLIIGKNQRYADLSLAKFLDVQQPNNLELAGPTIYLHEPSPREISDYKSDLVILEEGKIVKSKVIEVNEPLHYGGYHFYQSSYDEKAGQYTILSVSSDSGLAAVYFGFTLMAGGMFWLFWLKPVGSYLSRRRSDAS